MAGKTWKSYLRSTNLIKQLNLKSLGNIKPECYQEEILKLVNKLKQNKYSDIEDIYTQIKSVIQPHDEYSSIDYYLSWEQVAEMQQSGIHFGSHACSHQILTRLDEKEISNELLESSKILENITGKHPVAIAYPNGDSNSMVQEIARNTGYSIGFTTKSGLVSQNDNPYDLNRINMHEMKSCNNPLFMMALLGYY